MLNVKSDSSYPRTGAKWDPQKWIENENKLCPLSRFNDQIPIDLGSLRKDPGPPGNLIIDSDVTETV